MHAVMITFHSTVGLDLLAGPFAAYGRALRAVPGLLAKTWIQDGATFGGFHVFASREAAEGYLASEMVADLTANPAFSGFEVRHYAILEEFTRLTHEPLFAVSA